MSKKLYMKFETTPCWKCSGTGKIKEYSAISEGICFKCMGAKVLPASKEDAQIAKIYAMALEEVKKARQTSVENLKVGDYFKAQNAFTGVSKYIKIEEISGNYIKGTFYNQPFNLGIHPGMKVDCPIGIEKMFEVTFNALPEKYRPLLKVVEK
jgi:hypothetical protein